jgi:serine/threonine protein kinase
MVGVAFPASATTRLRSQSVSPAAPPLFEPGQVVASPDTHLEYRIAHLVGVGGFGEVYFATRLGRSAAVPKAVCIKVSRQIDGWLREAYIGQILDGHPRAIRVFDRFPLLRDGQTVYCLTLEYAPYGDLSAFLARSDKRWTETITRREIAGLLEVLAKLHRGQTLHRDLTPMNVFVCDGYRLKLGDFGIVRQQTSRRGVTADTMNALTAPSEIIAHAVPKWQTRDDVYQVGQLLAMLIRGDARARIRPNDVRGLSCTDHLKEIVYRCIGERRKRYESADEMINALRNPPATLRPGARRTLKGVHLAFTGILGVRRAEAIRAARRAGAVIHGSPSAQTTVVIRGRPNPLQAAGREGGLKLMEIKRLREKGYRITLLNESQFWRLAQAPLRVRASKPHARPRKRSS